MKFSEHWLRQYADPALSSEDLAARLTMAGLEVEDLHPVAPPFTGVVVAEVKTVARHPNADKLAVCEVDAGTGAPLQIVCGAPNVAVGLRVPCALAGAALPGGIAIKPTTMRGVQSQGMLCSARELGLSEDHGGLLELAPDTPIGVPLRQALDLDDLSFEVKLTPNRADALSVVGIAREVAALTDVPLTLPSFAAVAPLIDDRLPVTVRAPDLCGRFSGRVIRGVDARAATPGWMKRRLERSGQRPISVLVDISNYVMLELGRPTHVFDLAKVSGALEVRWGRTGESVELLNGQTVTVDHEVGVIADARGVEALAGVMGGEHTAVTLDTRDIYVEAAFWWPDAIRGRSRRYNFATDAAHRFERGVDATTTVEHLQYITRLILDLCGGRPGPVDDTLLALPERRPVALRPARARKVLGVALTDAEMEGALRRLGLPVQPVDGRLVVAPPPYRFDLEIEEDLIEEVARVIGFERIPALPPRAPAAMRVRPEARRDEHALRTALAGLGYQEVVNFSFVDAAWERDYAGSAAPIAVLNPIASHLAVMRSTLLPGLVQVLRHNLNRRATRVRVFEVGRAFRRDAAVGDGPLAVAGIAQPMRVAGLAYGLADDEQWGAAAREVDFFDVKGDVERLAGGRPLQFVRATHPALHPGRSAQVEADGVAIGWIGELHPRLLQAAELARAPVLFELDAAPLLDLGLPQVQPVPRQQPVLRDIAVTVDDAVPVQALLDAVRSEAAHDPRLAVLRDFRLFDLYRGRPADSSKVAEVPANTLLNKDKNLAFRVVLLDTERPLADADADAAMAAILVALQHGGARLRT